MKRDYAKMTVDALLEQCHTRLPGFAIDIHVFPRPMGGVMTRWRYDYIRSPMWRWQNVRPEEVRMGGTYHSVAEGLRAVLERCDRFEAWQVEQNDTARQEAAARARRAAQAAPQPKPDPDEGEEVVPAEPLPDITPLPEEPAEVAAVVGKPDETLPSSGR